ncbi:I78 family peptidase inhibitor [Pseudomonas sp. TUM22785]
MEQAKNAAGASDVRVLKPGSVMTLEYNSRRLNIDTDDTNLIKGVSCG